MKVSIFGLGYVGFTAMCCIAKEGHEVIGFDVNEEKINQINNGIPPISEPGIQELLTNGLATQKIRAFSNIENHLDDTDLAIVCVGTPSSPDGAHDMSYIAEVTRQIASKVQKVRQVPLTVAYRSTVRPGTVQELIAPIFIDKLGEGFEKTISLVYNPEFLREASAIQDYFEPPKIVIGTLNGAPNEHMAILNKNIDAPTFHVGLREAEVTKFVDNSWHAVKVAYANEVGRICLQLGIKVSKVHEIFVSDTKLNISPYYTRPGTAFGGSCLPKDVRAFQHIAADCGANTHLLDSLLRSNEAHKFKLYEHASSGLKAQASILLVGLAFKANTDDLRESPSVDLARQFLNAGYKLSIFDPAIQATKLIGANLGYAYTQLPTLSKLLVSKETAEQGSYDRVVITNATHEMLTFTENQDVIDLNTLS
ncbi:MAG: nucleotide sugar dehydrogenase [Oceanospirillales bacterium]|nr:nucleotide sugar dehydrogenase [Oceanospirillales bacterium]